MPRERGKGVLQSLDLSDTSTLDPVSIHKPQEDAARELLALVVVWDPEGSRLGEVLRFPSAFSSSGWIFGRATGDDTEPERLHLLRQRPGRCDRAEPFTNRFVSRHQLRMWTRRGGIEIQNTGRCPLLGEDGFKHARVTLGAGEMVELAGQLVLLCCPRPFDFAAGQARAQFEFGAADPHGMVGESHDVWGLRNDLALMGPSDEHVLIFGESGTGKELVAQALHASSRRAAKAMIARNAATFPAGLVDAELFGAAANYPNAGSPERPGLFGQARGSTLFLDEIGELPQELQAHLLRVLDGAGEYQRLGDARPRSVDVRLIGATNRSIDMLKVDFSARFKLRIRTTGLNDRREDIPFLVQHLLTSIAHKEPATMQRFLATREGNVLRSRTTPRLAKALVQHAYRTHARELESLLLRSIATSAGDALDRTPEVEDALVISEGERDSTSRTEVTADQIRASLAQHGGKREQAWRELGLSSRYALKRLMKKYGII